MIVVAIIGILAAIAYPSYQDYVLRGKRSDALAALSQAAQLQEKYRASNPTYGTLAQAGISATSPDNYYSITVPTNTATDYTITATAVGSQTADTACLTISLNRAGTFTPASCAGRN
ncbi:type IV pilin protein [Magnetovirga frankeli]|nr:type IV pilin protein [gamma proteobacterium SS-5]